MRRAPNKITTQDCAQHDQIIIMKNEWQSLCRKISELNLSGLDINNILLGTILSNIIFICYSFITKTKEFNAWLISEQEKISVFFFSIILYIVIYVWQKLKIWPFRCHRNLTENLTTLKFIKEEIAIINSRQDPQEQDQQRQH